MCSKFATESSSRWGRELPRPRTDPYVRLSRIRLPPRASTASRCRRRFAATVASGHATLALLPAYVRLQRNDHHNFRLVIRQKCGSIL